MGQGPISAFLDSRTPSQSPPNHFEERQSVEALLKTTRRLLAVSRMALEQSECRIKAANAALVDLDERIQHTQQRINKTLERVDQGKVAELNALPDESVVF
jgi:hypothetical protein